MDFDDLWLQIKINFSWNWLVMGICVILFILTSFFGLFNDALVFFGGNYLPLVLNGQVWRLLTAAFLHGNILHIVFNIYFLYQIGGFTEKFYGGKKYVIVFTVSAIGASLASLAWQFLLGALSPGGAGIVSVGSSGAIFGILGLLTGTLFFRQRISAWLPIDKNQLLMVVALNLFFGFTVPGIDNFAHIGGLVTGVLLSFLIEPENVFVKNTETKKKIVQIAYVLSIIAVLVSFALQLLVIGYSLTVSR